MDLRTCLLGFGEVLPTGFTKQGTFSSRELTAFQTCILLQTQQGVFDKDPCSMWYVMQGDFGCSLAKKLLRLIFKPHTMCIRPPLVTIYDPFSSILAYTFLNKLICTDAINKLQFWVGIVLRSSKHLERLFIFVYMDFWLKRSLQLTEVKLSGRITSSHCTL